MDERHADLVTALRDLGDGLLPSIPDEDTDPVAGALRRITASPSLLDDGGAAPGRPARPVRVRTPARRRARRLAVAAIAVLVVVGAVVALPGPRAAVADLLGIGGVRIVGSHDLPDRRPGGPSGSAGAGDEPAGGNDHVPADVTDGLGLGERVTVEEALAAAPGPLVPDGLDEPAAAFTGRPAGAATLAWDAGDGLPEIEVLAPTGWGLVLTAFPGSTTTPEILKAPTPSTTVEPVRVDGRSGYWISGQPHDVHILTPAGESGPDVVRLAGNTLLWTEGDVTYRLESGLDRDAAIAVAESVGP